MGLTQCVTIDKDKITYRIIDGEAVILNLDNGFYYSLNKIGTDIWKLLAEGKSREGIINIITNEYKTDIGKVKHDLTVFFDELKKETLIKIKGE